jgi:hypothetical protein
VPIDDLENRILAAKAKGNSATKPAVAVSTVPTNRREATSFGPNASPEQVAAKIAEMKAAGDARVQTVTIPGQRGSFEMLVETGADVLKPPSPTSVGQIDASVPSAQSFEQIRNEVAARNAKPPKPAQQINMNFKPGDNYVELEVGSLILRTTHLVGYERTLTVGAGDWQIVDSEGYVESTDAGVMRLLIAELRAMAEKKKVA